MNLAAARIELRSKIGNPTVANIPDSELTSVLNSAYRFIVGRYPFNEFRKLVTFPTATGTTRYILPPDIAWIRRMWDDTNKVKLTKKGISWLARIPLNTPTGKPRYYVRAEDWVQFVPGVDAVYSIMLYYQYQPPALALDADVPLFVESWHDGWVLKARHIYYDGKGDIGKAIYAKNEFKDWVSDKPSEIDQEKEDMDDVGVELPELSSWSPRRDLRFDPLFDTTL